MTTIYFWPDAAWAFEYEKEEFLTFKSDDYDWVKVPDSLTDSEIQDHIDYLTKQGLYKND